MGRLEIYHGGTIWHFPNDHQGGNSWADSFGLKGGMMQKRFMDRDTDSPDYPSQVKIIAAFKLKSYK